jgi:RimJ/RimL family protein N-acetyltransferase
VTLIPWEAVPGHHRAAVLDWLNAPSTLRGFNRFKVIGPGELEHVLAPSGVLWAAYPGEEVESVQGKVPVGVVALAFAHIVHGTAEVRVAVDEKWRGKGYGQAMLRKCVETVKIRSRFRKLYAYVLDHNEASKRAFAAAGFEKEAVLRGMRWSEGGWRDLEIWTCRVGEDVEPDLLAMDLVQTSEGFPA